MIILFYLNKSAPAIRKTGFYCMQTVIQTSRRLDSSLHEAAQNFEVFSNIQEWNKKNQEPVAVDVLFKAY